MPYCTKSEVKFILSINVTETTYDTELDACIASADGLIDSILKFHDFTVPLTGTIPQSVKDASKYFAAAYFQDRRVPQEMKKLYDRAMNFLNAYLESEEEVPFKVVQA